jgi:hypothetical protein
MGKNTEEKSAGIAEISSLLDKLSKEEKEKVSEALKERMEAEKETSEEAGLFDKKENKQRMARNEGGSMLMPPEMSMEEEMPVDTYTPEEQAMAEESQLPDVQMEDDYMGYVLGESLDDSEQDYLMGALESDPRLSEIFDKVVMTASEFSGAGKVEGPGDGVSDSIPARLSDGEFVVTEKATSEIGADNLQTMMDDAERMADGGIARTQKAMGGMLSPPMTVEEPNKLVSGFGLQQTQEEEEINNNMLGANRMPSLMGNRLY